MKKVLIVGAGIAGLSAGIYALQSGFNVTILEQHTIPGGNCTSWKRKGYLFEGGLHWLTGSSKNSALNKLWREVGALDDHTQIYQKNSFYTYYHNTQEACLYSDPDKLEKHFMSLSPEDEEEIKKLCNDIKKFAKIGMPVQDIKGVKVKHKSKMPFSMLTSLLPIMPKMAVYDKISAAEYSQRFKHPAIRALLMNMVGENLKATALFFTLGCFASGDGGYIKGGSLSLTRNMAARFTGLGGNIQYSSRVEKVITENGRAIGVKAGGQFIKADAVIVTADTVNATQNLFDPPLNEPWMERMRKNVKFIANTFICIGAETDLSDLPESMLFPIDHPLNIAGKEVSYLGLHNYAKYKGYAPKGCSALTISFMGDTYDVWKEKKQNGEYEAEKEKIAKEVTELLAQKLPRTAGKVAVVDVATPLTYERYCSTCHGSWMTLAEKGDKMMIYPSASEKIKGLYFAGQRLQAPGGLPVALYTGRKAVQHLCKDDDTVFQKKM